MLTTAFCETVIGILTGYCEILIVKIHLSGTLLVSKFFPFYSSSAVDLT
jgi:hypothetical protein